MSSKFSIVRETRMPFNRNPDD